MKTNKTKWIWAIAMLLVVWACDPIIDEEFELKNNATVDDVVLEVVQNAARGNSLSLRMTTPGIIGEWDYGIGRAFTDRVDFVYPIPGTSTFTFNGNLGAEFFSKTIDVTIDVLDTELEQDWYDLVSRSTDAGKTWVFHKENDNLWWYMSPPDDAASWAGVWWNAAECCAPSDANGKMKFDLNGGANFTYWENDSSTPVNASFALDIENQTLTIVGSNILGGHGDRGVSSGQYRIVSLTEDQMILYADRSNAGDSGWTYIFRPE